MKTDFQLAKPRDYDEHSDTYLVPFSIVGAIRVPNEEIVEASKKPMGMRTIEQQILTELSALIQVELHGRVLSNETPDKGAKDERLLSGVQTDPSGGEGQKSGS